MWISYFLTLKLTWECDSGLYFLWHVYPSHTHKWMNGNQWWVQNMDEKLRSWPLPAWRWLGEMYQFPSAAVTKYQNLSVLKQHKCTISQLWRAEVQHDGVAKALPPRRLGRIISSFWWGLANFSLQLPHSSLCLCHMFSPVSLSLWHNHPSHTDLGPILWPYLNLMTSVFK